ncbi:SipW-dependent-type signal peptide-containing protein [Halobellus captivus]|uniref:SipW-dependent-type signal peptide-containing protein n=1 Tax=Halobellus captivus TaxID=2592614 RepID=UPI0011A17367|nr:SipW-dependent-type signal peptide-containing protein [Halobellus captivus]
MTEKFEISRRKALAGLGTIGVASAGAGLGTSALFSDTESFENNIVTAGTLDLLVDYYSYWDQGSAGTGTVSGTADGEAVTAELGDVKPGDSGLIAFCPRIETNPAYLWMCGALTDSSENGYTEPEPEDGNGEGELEENIHVDVKYCEVGEIGDNFGPEDVSKVAKAWSGTLAELLSMGQSGITLDGEATVPNGGFPEPGEQSPFLGSNDGENYCLCLDWKVPRKVANEIQGDSLKFDLKFYAEQSRNNDGSDNPCSETFRINRAFSGTDSQSCDFSDPIELPYGDLGDEQVMNVALFGDPVVITIDLAKDPVDGQFPDNFGLAFDTDDDDVGDFQVLYTEGTGFEYEEPVASGNTGPLPSDISASADGNARFTIQIDRSKLGTSFSLGGKAGYASETPPSGSGNVVVNLTPEFCFGPDGFDDASTYQDVTLE